MILVYNLADTFFIGQTHDALQVAAVSLATPVFLIFMAVGTMFGVGGTSVISRAIGEGNTEYAKKVCSFCMWGCVAVGVILSACMLIFTDQILLMAGASADTLDLAKTYLVIVVCCGPFVLISNYYSNVVRTEGESAKAMMGTLIGNLLNVVLDPVFILGFGWNIAGAAIATVIGNVAGAVLAIGMPAALGSVLMSISQIIINSQMKVYGDMAIVAMGVAMKVVIITGMVSIGLGQGVQPVLGYCVGARLWERFKKVLRFSLIFALVLGVVLTGICYLFTNQIVSAFLTDSTASEYAVRFSRTLLTTSSLFGVFSVLTNALQAMGAATAAFIINISRQGIIYIPVLFILNIILGMTGLVWAQPVADAISIIVAYILYVKTSNRLKV